MQVPIATRRFVFIPMDLQDLSVGLLQVPNKQWGYKTSLTDEETLYPLPFTVLLGISAQLYRHPATSNTVHSILVNVTETSFKYYAGQYNLSCRPVPDADGWWFAFGISQLQWGFTNNTGRPYITFPFKFSNVFTAISCICHNGSPSEANTVYNVSISGMNIGASGGGSGKYWCAFGVAQPQWGTCGSGINNLPLRFNEKIFICVVTDITSSTTSSDGYFSFNNDKSTINSIFITSSGAYGGNYIVAGV